MEIHLNILKYRYWYRSVFSSTLIETHTRLSAVWPVRWSVYDVPHTNKVCKLHLSCSEVGRGRRRPDGQLAWEYDLEGPCRGKGKWVRLVKTKKGSASSIM